MASLLHVALFFVVLAIFFFMAYMIHYSIIQDEVRKKSRCLRVKEQYSAGGEYDVKAVDDQGTSLYKMTYNKGKKEVKHECACPKGETINHFEDVKYYDQKTATDRKIEDLMCSCDAAYDTVGADIFYEGHPGLVRYMQNSDGSFFTSDLKTAAIPPPREPSSSISVDAYSGTANLYSITYNTKTLSTSDATLISNPYKLTCKCPKGSKSNAFKFKVYDQSRKAVETTLPCSCDATYSETPTFKGAQGLVNFQGDSTKTGIFDNMKKND